MSVMWWSFQKTSFELIATTQSFLLSHIQKISSLAGFDIVAGFGVICTAKILEDELEELY